VHRTAEKVQGRLRDAGLDVEVRELPDSTRTAAEAAAAIGCDVGQIVKTLVFVVNDEPHVVLCAGDRRVAVDRLGNGARAAKADEVRAATGFAIGGVPPLGHDAPLPTTVDRSLERFDVVWCAAGTPHAVFGVGLGELLGALPQAQVADVGV
jgi:prolyl-tRNA editing enzyme YbaK/EbsC (Cys-tRNA(Pro) deacylase)